MCKMFPERTACRGCEWSSDPHLFDGLCLYYDLHMKAGEAVSESEMRKKKKEAGKDGR